MQLALQLGMTAEGLERSMTEAELNRWARYLSRHPMPQRRIELMLAQVCALIARTMGGSKNAKVADFLLQEPEEELPPNVTRLEIARQAFAFNPRRKKA